MKRIHFTFLFCLSTTFLLAQLNFSRSRSEVVSQLSDRLRDAVLPPHSGPANPTNPSSRAPLSPHRPAPTLNGRVKKRGMEAEFLEPSSIFLTGLTYGTGGVTAFSVAVADVSGDGKPDLVVANECMSSSNCTNGSVSVLLGNGDGTFQTGVTYNTGGFHADSVAVGDVNGDGKPDLVVTNECASNSCGTNGSVSVLLGNGDGTFQSAVSYNSGGSLLTTWRWLM